MQQKHYFLKTCLFIGFAFFYIPIFSMIFFSATQGNQRE